MDSPCLEHRKPKTLHLNRTALRISMAADSPCIAPGPIAQRLTRLEPAERAQRTYFKHTPLKQRTADDALADGQSDRNSDVEPSPVNDRTSR
ncbi:hypothetical protein EIP91_004654 [Steccherinum ochraceum]|uniref:Uncharacterized protein n=1 Tax=Steccherinum ochraceum TaxID=92696 RepID=A0A4R0R8E8_9APHY|nr:hypothetical protein EIP91_004654 [Steccherinum ochraceum]